MKAITTDDVEWNYTVPDNRSAKCLLLTSGKTAIIGKWGDGIGLIAWVPLPKRNKLLEKTL